MLRVNTVNPIRHEEQKLHAGMKGAGGGEAASVKLRHWARDTDQYDGLVFYFVRKYP